MTGDFEHVIAFGVPGVIQNAHAIGRVVDFASVHENLAFPRSDGPDDDNFVLFSATIRAGTTLIECLQVGKAKAPGKRKKK